MKHKYFIKRGDFSNVYTLRYTFGKDLPAPWERITRKQAIDYCIAERKRRGDDYNFSGYADIYIFRYDITKEELDNIFQLEKPMCISNYICVE